VVKHNGAEKKTIQTTLYHLIVQRGCGDGLQLFARRQHAFFSDPDRRCAWSTSRHAGFHPLL